MFAYRFDQTLTRRIDFNLVNNGLLQAAESFGDVQENEVSIMAPCFLIEVDRAGAATDQQLLFGETTWASGHKSVAPDSIDSISSYKVLDLLIAHYMDKDAYPNLQVHNARQIIEIQADSFLSLDRSSCWTQLGCSDGPTLRSNEAGEERRQKTALLGNKLRPLIPSHDTQKFPKVANPGSLLWLTKERPVPNPVCEGYDDYKYGFSGEFPAYSRSDAKRLGRSGLVDRYRSRNMHYAWGTVST